MDFILAKRFGLEQKHKVRVIDDCTIGGFNRTCGFSERMRVHAIDEMAAYLAWLLDESGGAMPSKVLGKTFDLKSAYEQCGISEDCYALLHGTLTKIDRCCLV